MMALDPRLTPARPDIAASHLRGHVQAARFSDGVAQEVIAGQAPVRSTPGHHATMVTEALRGERVIVYDVDDEGWAFGQLEADGYVGFLPASTLLAPGPQPTHRIGALRTFVFPEPSIKAPPVEALPLGSTVSVLRMDGAFAVTPTGFIPAPHCMPLDAREADPVTVAGRFVGTPYLWGGKSSLGIDCSGLVQVALAACGIACPRDSDMQEAAIGAPVSLRDLQRGDLVFWKGHVAIARDRDTIIHANAFHMTVAIEPLAEAMSRIAAVGSDITSVRRC